MPRNSILAGFAFIFFTIGTGVAGPLDVTAQRNRLVDEDLVSAGIKDKKVLEVMRTTDRHEFVPTADRAKSYFDMAIPIGESQTISPPSIVAFMTEQLELDPGDKVLEIGTGSGFQAAVLSPLAKDVYTIEIVKQLGERAAATLKRLKKYQNIHTRIGDGYQGWPEAAPFDKIIVTCSPENVPEKLVEQLKEGGRMIVPVGERYQQTLYLFTKKEGKLESSSLLPTLFVPMTGKAENERKIKPDPLRPTIENGGFEELSSVGDLPTTWYFTRQMELLTGQEAAEGKRCVRFSNKTPGRPAMALQALPVDGSKVHFLDVSCQVKGKNIEPGASDKELPALVIVFFDRNRAETGQTWLGPWRGTFEWQTVHERLRVPATAREAIVRIGLNLATGEILFDDVKLAVSTTAK
jgi:protein-L-isoaspartate(D-aspartate) O-methyltransferase